MAYNPEVQHAAAGMYVDLLAAGTLLEATAEACENDPETPDLPLRIMASKQVAVDAAKRVVDRAQEVAGGSAIATGTELERLFRDVRCGWFNGMKRVPHHRDDRQGRPRGRATTPVVNTGDASAETATGSLP